MAGSLNQLTLVGILGADPVLAASSTGQGAPWCHLMLATHETTIDGGEHTTWHRVTCWGDVAIAACQWLKKGSSCCVVGKLAYRVFRVGSQRRWAANISASRVVFMESGNGEAPALPVDAVDDSPE